LLINLKYFFLFTLKYDVGISSYYRLIYKQKKQHSILLNLIIQIW